LITIDAEFIGAVPGRMVAYETQNKSASMLFVSAPGTYKISEMLPALSFSSTVPLSSAPEKSVLENEILALENVEGIELNFPEPEYSITLSLDQNIPAVQPDLNLALWEVPGITEIGWRTAGMRIDYDGNYSVQEMESSIRSAIADTNFTITEMQLPEIEISAELTLANADARQTASALSSLLESRSLPAEIYQSALFKYETISDTEGNEYAVKNGEFTGFISPQYSAGAEIELDIFFFATRNSADSISAYEKEEAVPEGEAA
ncbi:hypothetical protein KKH30_03805, partial [Candidatus Micrarchaeota archaeon]|nr:hypothetical protein [Candidatus Micrarchaeota archaeon]